VSNDYTSLSFYEELEDYDIDQFIEDGLTTDPTDYYFAIEENADSYIDRSVFVCPKRLWDREHYASDSGWIAGLLEKSLDPERYCELMEATFETPQDLSTAQVRAELTTLGFEENRAILGQGVVNG